MRRIFLMMGQSNMCDRGWANELPVFANADRMFVYSRVTPVGPAEINTHGTWQQATGVIDPAGANPGQVGAMALAFMDKLCDYFPGDEIGVVSRCQPGTAIDSWRKWNRNTGNYGMAVERAWWALDECPVPAEISGFLWWQGEQDSTSSTDSPLWAERFGNIVSAVRVDLQKLNLPTAFVRLGGTAVPTGYPYWNTIRAQQDWMTMRNLRKVDIDGLTKLSDGVHYPTASYLEIGHRLADAMAPML